MIALTKLTKGKRWIVTVTSQFRFNKSSKGSTIKFMVSWAHRLQNHSFNEFQWFPCV